MNFLCVCYYGHSRSVAMVRAIHKRKQEKKTADDAVAVGAGVSAYETINYFCKWADRILVMQDGLQTYIPMEHRHKVTLTNVGADRWSNPYHPELGELCDKLLEAFMEKSCAS